jgi:hypothetical protein
MNAMIPRWILLTTFAWVFSMAGPVRADLVAAYTTTNTTGNQAFSGNLGVDFNVNAPIVVSALGAFDSGQNGFVGPITVGLFQRLPGGDPNTDHAGSVLTQLTITDSLGTLVGNYRFVNLATPLTLQPGFYSIVAVGFGSNDLNGNQFLGPFNVVTNSGGGAISFVGNGRFDSNTTLDYPALTTANQGFSGLPPNVFAAGSFEFLTTPEPSNLMLAGIGALCLLGRRMYRSRRAAA